METLYIRDCQQLEASAPRTLDLELLNCGKLQLDYATVKWLKMGGRNMETSLVEIVGSDTCQHLESNNYCVSLLTFPLDLFPTLRTLDLSWFDNLEMISQCLIHNHLERLESISCPKLELLPGNMHMLLPSLRRICIEDCPRLESFPSNLNEMRLKNCSRLVGSLKGAFADSSSLKNLWIDKVDAKCFPEEGLLPVSLTSHHL